VLVNYIREFQISHGVAAAQAYSFTMYLMAGLLVVGFVSNALVREVEQRFHISAAAGTGGVMTQEKQNRLELIAAWIWAGTPLIWGVGQTMEKAKALFP